MSVYKDVKDETKRDSLRAELSMIENSSNKIHTLLSQILNLFSDSADETGYPVNPSTSIDATVDRIMHTNNASLKMAGSLLERIGEIGSEKFNSVK